MILYRLVKWMEERANLIRKIRELKNGLEPGRESQASRSLIDKKINVEEQLLQQTSRWLESEAGVPGARLIGEWDSQGRIRKLRLTGIHMDKDLMDKNLIVGTDRRPVRQAEAASQAEPARPLNLPAEPVRLPWLAEDAADRATADLSLLHIAALADSLRETDVNLHR